MNIQINSKCTIWHFLYATQQNQAYMILSFHNQSTGCNFMMDGLYLCVHTVLDFCWKKTFHYNVNKKTWKNYISSQNQINPLAKTPVYLMTSYYNSFRLSYLVTVCYSVSKLGYLYIGELPVLSEDFTFLKSMAKIVDFRVLLWAVLFIPYSFLVDGV